MYFTVFSFDFIGFMLKNWHLKFSKHTNIVKKKKQMSNIYIFLLLLFFIRMLQLLTIKSFMAHKMRLYFSQILKHAEKDKTIFKALF